MRHRSPRTAYLLLAAGIALFLAVWLSAAPVAAVEFYTPRFQIENPIAAESFQEVIVRIANWATAISAPLLTLLVLYAGYLYLFSGGSEDMVKRARNALTWAVVGFIIILIAQGAAVLIKQIVGLP